MGKTRNSANLVSDNNISVDITNDRVGIGTIDPQYKLDVLGDINFTGTFRQNGSQFVASRWTSGTDDDIYRLNGNVGVGTTNPTSKLTVEGDAIITGIITCTDINSTSDANLKKNIQKLNNSIEILKQINPVSFNWKDNGKKSYGVIAQELEKVLPELIGEMNGNKTVSYTPLIALLINAILELDKKIEN
jgi:hypothetical protein